MNELEEFRSTILARQAEAKAAFVHGDPKPCMELWSRQDPVTLMGLGIEEKRIGRAEPDLPLGRVTVHRGKRLPVGHRSGRG
jgi:hypothetical protein